MKNDKGLEVSKNPFILMPILLFMWGSFAAASKLLLRHLDNYQVLFYMYGLAIIMFFIILIFKGSLKEILLWKVSEICLLISCGVLAFLYDILYVKALEVIPAVEASMLNYLFPIFIVVFAIPINKEKLNVYKIISITIGFIGTIVLITKGDLSNLNFTNFKGDIMAILAAVSWGLFSNLVKKNTKDTLISTFFTTFISFVLSIFGVILFSRFNVSEIADVYGLLWLSISHIVAAFFLYFQALKYSPASLIASFTFFSPCVTLVFIFLLLGEKLTMIEFFAALLILLSLPVQKIGAFINTKKESRQN
ncbi:hypothetical protein AXY43_15815 [Clostridium sp. MF28]|uniref:DMT family transporter n=1 Tax=Clostridium TaxID=1485 RepID=UPI000CF8C218|nr:MULTISPECIES: DMT family transporter [Clostridium]AVK49347.1 hypothetical protein AXY43_15815 [Clostridium sp. MF28]PSM58039.1 EamA family transporter [Clostridium diolis]